MRDYIYYQPHGKSFIKVYHFKSPDNTVARAFVADYFGLMDIPTLQDLHNGEDRGVVSLDDEGITLSQFIEEFGEPQFIVQE